MVRSETDPALRSQRGRNLLHDLDVFVRVATLGDCRACYLCLWVTWWLLSFSGIVFVLSGCFLISFYRLCSALAALLQHTSLACWLSGYHVTSWLNPTHWVRAFAW
jgi:hypothetical protein